MYKKLFSLALALMMLCMASMAMAAPSKTTSDLTSSDDGIAVSNSTSYDEQLEDIYAAIQNGVKAADLFGRSAIANVLSGVNLDTLVLNEFISVNLEGVGSGNKDFTFATPFKNNAKVVAVLGILNADGSVTWIPLKATVANGVVKINFTKAALAAAAGHQLFLAVLSAA